MIILDGKILALKLQEKLKKQTVEFNRLHNKSPGLSIILTTSDPATLLYVDNKIKASKQVGIKVNLYKNLKTQTEILDLVESLNNDKDTHAILVQLPVNSGLDKRAIINKINSEKDVDCLNYENLGKVFCGDQLISPCTAEGIIALIDYYNIPISGKHVVIVGRSNIVGKPTLKLFLDKNATVTICHSKTKNLEMFTKIGDIVVVAIGKKRYFGNTAFNRQATVVDVGIHKDSDGICGDVKFEELDVYAVTPVPGGVGPMTVTMLLQNTLYLANQIENL